LPTMAWQWETPWYVDSQFNGTNLDKEVHWLIQLLHNFVRFKALPIDLVK
jgi:hypothetical protein